MTELAESMTLPASCPSGCVPVRPQQTGAAATQPATQEIDPRDACASFQTPHTSHLPSRISHRSLSWYVWYGVIDNATTNAALLCTTHPNTQNVNFSQDCVPPNCDSWQHDSRTACARAIPGIITANHLLSHQALPSSEQT